MKHDILTQTSGAVSPLPLMKVRSFLKRASAVSLSPFEPLRDAARYLSSSVRKHFPVIHDGRLVGILSRASLSAALRERGEWVPVAEVMTKNPHSIARSRIPARQFFRNIA